MASSVLTAADRSAVAVTDSSRDTVTREVHRTMLAERIENTVSTESRATLAIRELLLRIEGEYREMPGLNLSSSQAERLWALDSTTCSVVLTTLVERGVLRRTAIGTYVRGPSG